jgi:hypothetical protein
MKEEPVKKTLLFFFLVFFATGCVSMETMALRTMNLVDYTPHAYLPKAPGTTVDLFFEGAPTRPYETIGEILGYVDEGYPVREMLAIRVRQAGGDGAISITTKSDTREDTEIVDVRETGHRGRSYDVPVAKTNYYSIVSVTAKVIKYKN